MTPLRSVSRDAKALRAHTYRSLHWRSTPNPLARELVLARHHVGCDQTLSYFAKC